jgi:hypothetical protein
MKMLGHRSREAYEGLTDGEKYLVRLMQMFDGEIKGLIDGDTWHLGCDGLIDGLTEGLTDGLIKEILMPKNRWTNRWTNEGQLTD